MRKHHDVFFIQGSGFRVQGSGFRVQGSGFRVQGSGFRVQGSGFRVQGSGGGFAAKKEANPASLRSAAPSKGRGSCGCSLLPLEGGAPKGRRLEGESGSLDTQPSPRGGRCPEGADRVLAV